MESNVWTQLFAQAASFLSNLYVSSSNPKNQSNGGVSLNVQENVVDSTLTSSNAISQAVLKVIRNPGLTTQDALFGAMDYNGEIIGVTMERTAVSIPEGTYPTHKEISPHFGFETPHLTVPDRTYIEIHPANYPSQLEGCIAVGTTKDNDSLDNSRAAFDKMMAFLPQEFTVEISSL